MQWNRAFSFQHWNLVSDVTDSRCASQMNDKWEPALWSQFMAPALGTCIMALARNEREKELWIVTIKMMKWQAECGGN